MADSTKTDSPANNGEGSSKAVRAGGWTDGERNQLLLRVLATFLVEGKGVEWKKIEMEGRSLKAMQGQWTSILAQIRDLNISSDGPSTPAKPRAPRKKTPKKAAKSDGDEDANDGDEGAEEADTPKKPVTPRKRGAAAAATDGSAKKRRGGKKTPAKVEADDEQQEEEEKTDEKVKPEENADENEQ